MDYIPWDDAFLVGVEAFDSDHKYLVKLINGLHSGLMAGFDVSEMTYILDDLVRYTEVHFTREEDLMTAHGYPEYEEHRGAHAELMEKVMDFRDQLASGKKVFSLELMAFLKDWLLNHILKADRRYSGFFRERL